MGEVVKPMMESRLLRIIANTSKLDRIRYRESQKTEQERQLTRLKTAPLPLVKPSLTRVRDAKCGKCDVELKSFTKLDDWYMEPIDALTMKPYAQTNVEGWWNRKRLCVYSLRKILSHSMSSLVIHPAQIKMMKNIQKSHPTIPLVFVLNSKSPQWDLLLVAYVLLVNGFNLLLAVDSQLEDIPIVGRILKELNLTFFDKDEKTGDAQIEAQLQANGNILMVDDDDDKRRLRAVLTSSVEVFFLPVSVNAEKARKDLRLLDGSNLGIVKINFHEPYTAADLLKASDADEMFPHQQADDKVMTISQHLQYDVSMKRPIMSTNVVAFLLTTEFRDGASVSDLARKLDALCKNNLCIDFAFEGEAEDIVEHAIDILGEELVEIKGDCIKAKASSIVQLSEYAKPLFPLFALQSILIIAAQSLKRSESFVDFNTLMTSAVDLCELLQCEIKCAKPCGDLVVQLTREFDLCSLKGIMHKPVVEPLTSNELRAQRMARQFEEEGSSSDDDDDGYQSRNANNEVTINDENSKEIDALKNVTMPIIDAYLTVACCLKKFIGKPKFTEQEFTRKSVEIMREELEDGNCEFWESCSEEFVASSLKCLQLFHMIEVEETNGDSKLISIHPDFNNSKSIKFLIEKINRFL